VISREQGMADKRGGNAVKRGEMVQGKDGNENRE